jgi:hypothetical protein
MTAKTISLLLIATFGAIGFAFSENKQRLIINGVVVQAPNGKVVNLDLKKQMVPFLGVYAVPLKSLLSKQLKLPIGLHLAVEEAIPDSPAAKAGLERFDVLMQFDDQILVNPEQLKALVRSKKKGDLVKLSILRGGEKKTIEVQLEEQHVPEIMLGQALPIPVPGNIELDFGPVLPFGPDAQVLGLEELRERMGALRNRQMNRPMQRFGRGAAIVDPELLEKYDADGDGKLSPMERDKARDEGAIPQPNFGFGLDIEPMLPNVDDLLRDARRRGAASTWSSVSGSAQTKIVTMDETGSYEFSSNNGKKRFKATSRAGDVLFDGPVNTKEEKAKVPEDLRQRLDSIENNVEVRIGSGNDGRVRPQIRQRERNPKGNQKNRLL